MAPSEETNGCASAMEQYFGIFADLFGLGLESNMGLQGSGGSASFGKKTLGVIRLDDTVAARAPTIIGDYRMKYVRVMGLTYEKCLEGNVNLELMMSLRRAVKMLQQENANLVGITGEIAALQRYQCPARYMADAPVFMSPLIQCPMVAAAWKDTEKVLIMAPDTNRLEPLRDVFLKETGFDLKNTARFELAGFEDCEVYSDCASGKKVEPAAVEAAIVKHVKRHLTSNAELRGIMLTGTDLLPFSNALREATGRPVFDHITCLDFFQKATSNSHWNNDTYNPHNPAYWEKNYKGLKHDNTTCSKGPKAEAQQTFRPEQQKVLGVLRIDYSYPPLVGDIDHPDSYDYEVIFQVVEGLTFERCQSGAVDAEITAAFKKAVAELEKEPRLMGITGDCGFMMHYQRLARGFAKVPVFMSALVQCPTIAAAFKNDAKIMVVTANSESLLPARDLLLKTCGITISDPNRFVIEGMQDLDGFEAVANAEAVPAEKVKARITSRLKKRLKKDPDIRAILLEGTELPHYADALRRATGRPVFDAITCVNFFRSAAITNQWDHSYNADKSGSWMGMRSKLRLSSKLK